MRNAFNQFFKEPLQRARQKHIHWQIIVSGSRDQAHENFRNAMISHPGAINLLLVDAEAEVKTYGEVWQHLLTRESWINPKVDNDRCHLMVCTMEAWFVADRETLTHYFGKPPNTVKGYADIEQVPKSTIEGIMAKVSKRLGKREYHKIHDGTRLLSSINPEIVQSKAPHCRRLFEELIRVIEAL